MPDQDLYEEVKAILDTVKYAFECIEAITNGQGPHKTSHVLTVLGEAKTQIEGIL